MHARDASYRLRPEHYAPARVPGLVARYASSLDTLGVGRPGKIGLLELGFERVGDRTELVSQFQKSPLQIIRPLYFDPCRPDMPLTYVLSTGGGIVQGDRLRMDVSCGPDTASHLSTQAATKVYRMDQDYATMMVNLRAGPRAYLEYLPDPVIAHAGARIYQPTVVDVDPSATVLLAETVFAGRLARGERHAYDAFAADLEIRRPGGDLVAADTIRLDPAGSGPAGPAVLGSHDIMLSFYVISPLASADALADALARAVEGSGLTAGVSVLPEDCGAWLRLLGSDSPMVRETMLRIWSTVRQLLIGVPSPDLRKT